METNIYSQPKLPYAPDALAPIISSETISYHWGKHEKTYIDNLNKLIRDTEWEDMPLEDIIKKASGPLFNNASQAWNHIFYFFSFSPDGGGEPEGDLAEAIVREFGSFEEFKKLFEEAGVNLFGSGWVWLSQDGDGRLFITQGPNAANPLTQGLTPILTFDVWEHAYYLQYQNRRAEYLDQWFPLIDWRVVEYNAFQNGIAR